MARVVVGVIGGTGLGEALGTIGAGEVRQVETPFGRPSSPITLTEVGGVPVALLSRHGEGHVFNPSTVPYRANVWALKSLGVTHVLAAGPEFKSLAKNTIEDDGTDFDATPAISNGKLLMRSNKALYCIAAK